MKIAIITRSDDRSPKVLAQGLEAMLKAAGAGCTIFYETGALIRLQSLTQALKFPVTVPKRIYSKLKFFKRDKNFLRELRNYDAVIVSECTPNGFWRGYYAIEKLKRRIKKPILFYEVYYLGNAPTQLERLKQEGEPGPERYDWHLAVTDVTEIRTSAGKGWTRVGLDLSYTGLRPLPKKEFLVLVDFVQPGYEHYRQEQLEVLDKAGIAYVALEGSYTMEAIRALYRRASVLLIQFPEAFGLPIAECLACGAYIFTPDSSWAMSWRLDEQPGVHEKGKLAPCFVEYADAPDLKNKLLDLQAHYDLEKTPATVFTQFVEYYPHFYYGERDVVKSLLKMIENGLFEKN